MNVRGYHWNIKGKQFFVLHAKFEEVYNNLNEMADEVAERILILGGKPLHSFSEYLKISEIEEIDPKWFAGVKSVGICGATSTPNWLMEQAAQWVHENFD